MEDEEAAGEDEEAAVGGEEEEEVGEMVGGAKADMEEARGVATSIKFLI